MVLILGIGNSLLQDDGIGCHLVERLNHEKANWPVKFLDGGTMSFDLVSTIELSSHLIIIDAANLHKPPGSIETFMDHNLDDFLSKPGKSVHEVSLSDLFDMARLTERLPSFRAMIAIQPKVITWGENLSPAVDLAQESVIKKIEKLLLDWGILPTTADNYFEKNPIGIL